MTEPNNYDLLIIYVIAISALLFCLALTVLIIQIILNNKCKNKMIELSKHKMHISAQIDKSIPDLLEFIIQESFEDYIATTLIPLDEGYINSDREKEIRNDLVNVITDRISPVALEKIAIFYNENNIAKIMADKIYISVMAYVVEHNKPWASNSIQTSNKNE